jgi:hypothetical protein
MTIADQVVIVTQDGTTVRGPNITGVVRQGKNLLIIGEHFDSGAVILMNGEPQKTLHSEENSSTVLIAKKLFKRIEAGQTVMLQVRNSDDSSSLQFSYEDSDPKRFGDGTLRQPASR